MTATTTGSTAASYATPAPSVARMFLDRVAATPDREAFRYPTATGWESLTWRRTGERVEAIAAGLVAEGVQPEDRVAIISATRLEWVLADLGIMCAGAATTTVYPTTVAEDVTYILTDSGTRVVLAEDATQVAKLRAQKAQLPRVERVVQLEGTPDAHDDDWVVSLDALTRRGRDHLSDHPDAVTKAVDGVRPDHLATLMYTSGTTGKPKGVRLTQSCWTYEGAAIEGIGLLRADDVQYLWLPLSHSFGKVLMAGQLQVGFATAVDGRVDKIVENLAVVRPTFMAGAPRIFEKVHARVTQTAHGEGGLKAKIFDWAISVGTQVSEARLAGKAPSPLVLAQHLVADRLVFAKIRARLGGNIRYLVSGSAALSAEVGGWFHAVGLTILEGYGLTETSAATCVNRPGNFMFGTVGEPLPGTEVRIADDGEVLVRGPGVMRGYHGLDAQSAEVLLDDGWFATGDIGEIDERGRVRITDRKKDLVKTSGGKYIAPGAIEARFKAMCPIAGQILVHADRRNYATALVTLDPDALATWAEHQGAGGTDYAALVHDEGVHAYVEASVEKLNGVLNRWETIKDFRILDRDLTVEDGELTPSLKIRRRVVEEKFSGVLDSMYEKG
ncbi:MAG: AMP-dependent synthetase/ligase [Actinomycetes bacterium]